MQFLYPNGATPLDPDEAAGLLPSHISLQADLNDWEQTNIGLKFQSNSAFYLTTHATGSITTSTKLMKPLLGFIIN